MFAPHYARPLVHGCTAVTAEMRAEPSANATAVSELLRGDRFAVVDVSGGWAWGYSLHDHYVGYVALGALDTPFEPTHRVVSTAALVFRAADIKSPVMARLPMGVAVAGTLVGNFLETAQGFIHLRHLRPVGETEADPVAVAERLIGAPYKWGGRSGDGLDCSGLVQLALAFAGISAPRDSDQQAALGREIAADEPLRRGDLVFFPGHVGFMGDAGTLVHANAFWMATVREPLADVVARLSSDHAQPIVARRRL